jgi:hypothetical protein
VRAVALAQQADEQPAERPRAEHEQRRERRRPVEVLDVAHSGERGARRQQLRDGAVEPGYTAGFERAVRATGSSAKRIKRHINQELIYPPLDDAAEILRRADHQAARTPSAV